MFWPRLLKKLGLVRIKDLNTRIDCVIARYEKNTSYGRGTINGMHYIKRIIEQGYCVDNYIDLPKEVLDRVDTKGETRSNGIT
jgi:hypothetical protein